MDESDGTPKGITSACDSSVTEASFARPLGPTSPPKMATKPHRSPAERGGLLWRGGLPVNFGAPLLAHAVRRDQVDGKFVLQPLHVWAGRMADHCRGRKNADELPLKGRRNLRTSSGNRLTRQTRCWWPRRQTGTPDDTLRAGGLATHPSRLEVARASEGDSYEQGCSYERLRRGSQEMAAGS